MCHTWLVEGLRRESSWVTEDEALRTLGVAADADAQAVRRAYLKLIKLHSPERDPDRFKQIREAFGLPASKRR